MSLTVNQPILSFPNSQSLAQLLDTMPAISSYPSCEPVRACPVIIPYPWVQGLCGVPDDPHAANVSLLNAEGSGVGKFKVPPVTESVLPKWDEVTKQSTQDAVVLTFQFHLTENKNIQWNTVVWHRRLYVQVPDGSMSDGSKEAFLSLLEFCEEELQCSHVIVCFSKSRSDRALLVRTFMFLGFAMLAPGHHLAPSNTSEDTLCMVYSFE